LGKAGNLYIAGGNNTTVAGTGEAGFSGNGVPPAVRV
jgi:hypothetical protein